MDTKKERDAYIYVDSAGGWYACANDYHFKNLTMPIGDQDTEFYAGSGNISFENVYFKDQTVTINDAEEQAIMHQLIHDVARTVATKNNAELVPAGDAWMELINNTPEIGNELWRSNKKNVPYGDYQHDGDIGGGQYLNACVWYEVLTRKSCVGNTWRPTKDLCGYTLEKSMIEALQNAAHKVVEAHYGKDYYNDSFDYDTIKDNEINILVIGSSTGYYFVDEVSQLLNAEGITSRVGMAYHSGVKLSEQWSWADSGTGDYSFRLYEKDSVTASVNTAAGAMFTGSGFDNFIELYDWDAIGIYQAPGAFDDKISLDAYERCLATCNVATNLYEFYKTYNPDSRYLWYQGATKAVGYPGVSSKEEGFFYGDTCTDAVFSGWKELAEGETVETGITFLGGTAYYDSSTKRIAAVNYLSGGTEAVLTEAEAKEIRYPTSSYENVADIRPIDVVATITIDGADCSFYDVVCKTGGAPSVGKLHLKNGTVHNLQGDTNIDKAAGEEENYYGDMVIKMTGGKISNSIYMSWDLNLVGNLEIHLEGTKDAPLTQAVKTVRGHFGTGTVTGDTTITIRYAEVINNYYGGGSKGKVVNIIENSDIGQDFFGVRVNNPSSVSNTLTNATVGRDYYGGHYKGSIPGSITNNLNTVTLGNLAHMGSFSSGYTTSGNLSNTLNKVTAHGITSMGNNAGGTISGNITSSIYDCTFLSDLYLSSFSGTIKKSVSSTLEKVTVQRATAKGTNSDGDSVTITLNALYGGQNSGTISGDLKTTFISGTVDTHAVFGGKGTVSGSITNTISGGKFSLNSCGGSYTKVGKNINNTISGAVTFGHAFYGGCFLEISNTVGGNISNVVEKDSQGKAPSFGKAPPYYLSKDGTAENFYEVGNSEFAFLGGNQKGTVTGFIHNKIEAGTYSGHWHGGGNKDTVKGADSEGYSIKNVISGDPVFKFRWYGGMISPVSVANEIYNDISGGTYKYEVAASHRAAAKPYLTSTSFNHDVTTRIHGNPIFEKYVCGVARGWIVEQSARIRVLGTCTMTIEGGTFKGAVSVYGLCNFGQYYDDTRPGARIEEGGSVTVNVNGGTFHGKILATSDNYDASLYKGYATVNIAPTKGTVTLLDTVASRFGNELVHVEGGSYPIVLGESASLSATSAKGNIRLLQSESWKMNTTYLTLPKGNNAVVSTGLTGNGKGVTTKLYERESVVEVKGGASLYGVTFILDDRLNIRAVFEPEVASYGEDFKYKFTMNGTTLAEGTELTDYKGYATVVLKGLGAKDFATPITYSGDNLYGGTISVVELADHAATVWTEDVLVRLSKAIADFGRVAGGEEPVYSLQASSVSWTRPTGASAPQDTTIRFEGKSLLMNNAVGIRLHGTEFGGDGAELDLKVRVNGADVTELCKILATENGGFTLDMFVSASKMNREFSIVITNGAETESYLVLTERLDAFAYEYIKSGNALANQLLLYIQTANEYFHGSSSDAA